MTPEKFVDLVLTPPPPSLTKITEEQAPAPQSVSPLDLYKSTMPEAVKEKFDRDSDLQAFFETLPALLKSAQKISTQAPIFTGQSAQPPIVATITSTFKRNPDKEGKVIGHRSSIIAPTDPVPQTDLPTTAPSEGELHLNSHP